jgi:hypothetical protein
MPPPVQNVPKNQVGAVVQGFVDAGCNNVQVTKNAGGTYDVTAQ